MPEQFSDIGGAITLCYETFGSESDPPMLLIMGLGMSMLGWPEDFCEQLAGRGFYVVRFDNRDAGRSTRIHGRPPTPGQLLRRKISPVLYDLGDMANDAAGLLRELESRAGARRRRVDGRHDRPDSRRPASGLGPLAGVDHVDDRQPVVGPAGVPDLPLPTARRRPPSARRTSSTCRRCSRRSDRPGCPRTPSGSAT